MWEAVIVLGFLYVLHILLSILCALFALRLLLFLLYPVLRRRKRRRRRKPDTGEVPIEPKPRSLLTTLAAVLGVLLAIANAALLSLLACYMFLSDRRIVLAATLILLADATAYLFLRHFRSGEGGNAFAQRMRAFGNSVLGGRPWLFRLPGWSALAGAVVGLLLLLFYYEPVPEYLPLHDSWKEVERAYEDGFGRRWYFRYEAPQDYGMAAESIKPCLDAVADWERVEDLTSDEVYHKLRRHWPRAPEAVPDNWSNWDKVFSKELVVSACSPPGMRTHCMEMVGPFRLMRRFRHSDDRTFHLYLYVRVMKMGENESVVEVWDSALFDH